MNKKNALGPTDQITKEKERKMAKKIRKQASDRTATKASIKPSNAVLTAKPAAIKSTAFKLAAEKPMAHSVQSTGYQANTSQPIKPMVVAPTVSRTPGLIKPMGVINYGGYNSGSSPTASKDTSNPAQNERFPSKSSMYPTPQEKP